MARNARKRQRKLERQKRKAKAERMALARAESGGLPAKLREAGSAPILHCLALNSLWSLGMGEVLVSRQLRNGDVAFGMFLVDRYCLGVKNAFANVVSRGRYEEQLYDKLVEREAHTKLSGEDARKLVEGAVRYAEGLGLAPHPDYRTARLIFGDLRAEDSTRQFEYGKDGQPFFISGPHDTPARCDYILRTIAAASARSQPAIPAE